MASKKRSEVMMDEQLSALLDDELAAMAGERAISRVANSPDLRDAWSRQHLLRAALAGEDRCLPDEGFADRVMAELAADAEITLQSKVVPIARRQQHKWWAAGGLAMAASLVGVALVLGVMPVERPGNAAMVAAAQQEHMRKAAAQADIQRELEEYLIEHQRLAARHGLAAPRGYMRMATPGFTQVSYSGE